RAAPGARARETRARSLVLGTAGREHGHRLRPAPRGRRPPRRNCRVSSCRLSWRSIYARRPRVRSNGGCNLPRRASRARCEMSPPHLKRMSAVRREALLIDLPSMRDHAVGSAFSNLRARLIAAGTCAGAVPPRCARIAQGIRRVEQRLLVFLIVLVVGKSLSLHQSEQRDEIAGNPPSLAAREFRNVGVLLLGHDR